MLKAIKRKFTNPQPTSTAPDDSEDHADAIKRPRLEKRPKAAGAFARLGRRIRNFVGQLRTPNFRRAGAYRLFTTPEERRSIRYEMTPARPLAMTAGEWRNRHNMVYGDRVPVTETKNFEFKTGGGNYPITILPEHIRKYGSAFLNSEGGVLLAGILDDGTIHGIRCDRRKMQNIKNTIDKEFGCFLPHVGRNLYSINFVQVQTRTRRGVEILRDYYVLEVLVHPGEPGEIYEDGKHQVYIKREGSVEGPLNPLQIKDIVIQKYRKILDERRTKKRTQQEKKENESRRVIVISP